MSLTLEQRNLATAEALYAATAAGDWDKAESMLSDSLVITEADTLPYRGSYTGKGALRALYAKVLGSALGQATIEVKGVMAGGANVAYILELKTVKGDCIELVEVFYFGDNGQVTEIKPYYFDSDVVTRAVAQAQG